MGEQRPVIEVKNLYKIFRLGEQKVRALNGVSFEVSRGEFVAIVGTSGSGKSTLLNMLAGLEGPTKGTVRVAGENIEKYTERQLVKYRRDHVGFIFQAYNLMPTLNAIENVALPLTFRGVDKAVREKLAVKALKLVGLKKYMDHRPTEMSGGQQQRVGIARALVLEPEIIFADEPTGNLDSVTTEEILHLLQDLVRRKKTTLVMVTHDNHLASFADRIIRIKDGKIISDEKKDKGEIQDV